MIRSAPIYILFGLQELYRIVFQGYSYLTDHTHYKHREPWIVWVNNIIAIPHGKGTVHAQISGYYSSKQFSTGGQTVRQWLTGQSFQEQFGFGMNLLKQYGTVTPTDNGWIFTPF